ncbi:MAG: mannosyltransferase [Solirubrobacterales bacterium]|nr:mannosyltransferase [Solirubrobacterales bacterium]
MRAVVRAMRTRVPARPQLTARTPELDPETETALEEHQTAEGPATPRPAPRPRQPAPQLLQKPAEAQPHATGWRQRRPWMIVGALLVIGLAVRVVLMRSIWVDEAISIHQAHMSLGGMLDNLRATDRHPPLHYLILWLTVRLFGDGELAVRGPSILASAALIPVLFVTGRELFDRRTGLVAAGFVTIAPLVVWYGQEARMYALFMLLGAVALWAQVMVLRDGRNRYWVAYAGVTIALLYTHYFALIPIAIQQVVFAVVAWRRAHAGIPVRNLVIGIWLTWLALLVAAAPLASFAAEQFSHSQAAGMGFGGAPSAAAPLSIPGSSASLYAILSNFVWAIWGYHANSTMLRIAALWPLLMLLSLALMGQRRSDSTRVVLALALGPVVVLLFVGLVKRDLFEVRYFIATVPMMMLLLARAVAGGPRRRTPAIVATAVLGLTLLIGLADQQLNPNNPRDFDFRGALEQIRSEAHPGDTVLYAPDYLRDVVGYYSPGVRTESLSDAVAHGMPTSGHIFLMGSFLDDPGTAAQVGTGRYDLSRRPHRLIRTINREQIRIWVYS